MANENDQSFSVRGTVYTFPLRSLTFGQWRELLKKERAEGTDAYETIAWVIERATENAHGTLTRENLDAMDGFLVQALYRTAINLSSLKTEELQAVANR
ncbi:MAG: hypothetical protein JO340_16170 [Acidobacteriaceae bacterium]|nr:hypothetical protein [Acidobacteriaceae bacterium]